MVRPLGEGYKMLRAKKIFKLLFIIIQITFATDLCLKNGDAFASPACTLDQSVSRLRGLHRFHNDISDIQQKAAKSCLLNVQHCMKLDTCPCIGYTYVYIAKY